ncbi:ATP-dependent 6-phosphofructokinase [Aliifodinibius sp. S!AR15-10]|uniref:6-phosphofructokinase n=1 Tax=Aliifodinibius sp. S!AR15-10 TaxID=2950437 RepID=UPI0028668BAE|nr:ATP-dependent 6-phosphofructokinase [Aliifodinibius sp. S!AR15-10]MDR8393224.1 ATP-dependent 6-phosphofructokinase [Aliifodinibius sp. S!AR15-10]
MRIAINTGGGDAPGLNAAIRSATLAALKRGWEVFGIKNGYGSVYTEKPFIKMDEESVRGITLLGGTILGTANRGNPFEMPYEKEDGTQGLKDVSDHLVAKFNEYNIDALVAIGGDGSMHIAHKLTQKGIKIVGVPKTIDNDLWGCDVTLGFDTARSIATEAIDRITTTAESHERLMVVEVMGRYAGWIALYSGLASTADVILIPEIPFSYDSIVEKIKERRSKGKNYTMIVVAEGAKPEGGDIVTKGKTLGQQEQLGGIASQVAHELSERTGQESRSVVLGHLQRGGSPTTYDRLISMRYGASAIRCVENGDFNELVVLQDNKLTTIPLSEVAGKMKYVPLDSDIVQTARDVGICMGD